MAPAKPPTKATKPGSFVLGRARFEKISAVEGIKTAPATQRMFAEFDRKGVAQEQRRQAVAAKFVRKG